MECYQFTDNQFIKSDVETATLRCIPFDQLETVAAENGWPSTMITEVLNAKNDAYVERYRDHMLFSLTIKNHTQLEKNEELVFIKHAQTALLFYDETLRTPQDYIEIINYVYSQIGEVDDANLLIPYALTRYDLLTDRTFLRDLENTILELELSLTREPKNPEESILSLRKTLSIYKHHYMSLIDLFEDITDDYRELLTLEAARDYQRILNKLNRLYKYTTMLGEYVSQINDRYRAQIDLNLNKTMKTFTILSAVFLPLTLIVGWYGMNFQGMPELESKYGYLYVIILSISILIGSLLYIRHRGFWD